MRARLVVMAVSGLAMVGCTEEREVTTPRACFDFRADIQPILDAECVQCHGLALAEGGYRVDSFEEVFARDEDGMGRLTAGDEMSPFLTCSNSQDREAMATLERWVVQCRLSFLETDLVHPYGWVDPRAEDFHGLHVRESGWDFEACADCHGPGDDPAGGGAGKSCTDCHDGGPTECDTCHGDADSPAPPRGLEEEAVGASDPGVGVHRIHVLGGPILDAPVPCDSCHVEPGKWDDRGHLFRQDGSVDDDRRAEVSFSAFAGGRLEGRESRWVGPPSYDYETGTCMNVYCHGGALAEPTELTWTGGNDGNDGCTTCHNDPPAAGTHRPGLVSADCVACHGAVVDVDSIIIDPGLHIDGKLSFGDDSGTCGACHGSATNAAPPVGLGGEASTDELAVGAHQTHVGATSTSSGLRCAACHIEPPAVPFVEGVASTDHLDTDLPVEVFPGGASFAGLAAADGATPDYDPATGTCSGIYCHGSGSLLIQDNPSGPVPIVRTLLWTDVGNNTIVCGSCHGIPMSVGTGHLASYTLIDCVLCHSLTVDETGAIVFDAGGSTRHINGRPDFNQ